MSDEAIKKALEAIREAMDNKRPAPCNPTFMDSEDQWWQVRHWHTLGLVKNSTGPHGKKSKVKPSVSWAHDLMPDAYPTLAALLEAMEASRDE